MQGLSGRRILCCSIGCHDYHLRLCRLKYRVLVFLTCPKVDLHESDILYAVTMRGEEVHPSMRVAYMKRKGVQESTYHYSGLLDLLTKHQNPNLA